MESMKNYFDYEFHCMCGIPSVTLEGKLADYKSIIERIDALIALVPDFAVSIVSVPDIAVKFLFASKAFYSLALSP
jgi:hypothetical protein